MTALVKDSVTIPSVGGVAITEENDTVAGSPAESAYLQLLRHLLQMAS